MIFRFTLSLSLFCLSLIMTGCTTLFSEQEWSENYALMDGVNASSSQMIDGDLNTVGLTETIGKRAAYGSSWGSVASIKFPEKKNIRRTVIHSDNIKKLNIYVDKGGSALSETDWHLIKEIKGVKSYPIVIPLLNTFSTDHLRILVTDTTDDDAIRRREKAGVRQSATPREKKCPELMVTRNLVPNTPPESVKLRFTAINLIQKLRQQNLTRNAKVSLMRYSNRIKHISCVDMRFKLKRDTIEP